jgi:hypothetical protein
LNYIYLESFLSFNHRYNNYVTSIKNYLDMLWTCGCLFLQSIIDGSLLADEVRVGQELVQLVVRQTEVLSEFLGAITSEKFI